MKKSGTFYSGCSGLVLPVPNKSHYPAAFRDKSRLCYYASLFNSIEINSSFYKIPQPKTIQKWSEMVPEDFRFSFKVSREITHRKNLSYSREDIDRFLTAVAGAGDKKGCLLIQLPGGIKSNHYNQLESVLKDITDHPLSKGWNPAVEVRDHSWYMAETWELLNEFSAALVYQDIPKSLTPKIAMKSRIVYYRYHGPTGNYRGSYTGAKLEKDSREMDDFLQKGKTVFAYFNNTLGEATENLQSLNQLVRGPATA